MKKAVKIIWIVIAVLIMAPIVIFNIQSIIISAMFHMPSEMKEETVCFLAPGLTWDSTRSDVEGCFGLQVKDSHYIEETGKVIETYNASCENRLMTVETTRRAFVITDVFHKSRIHRYDFDIECSDENDEKVVFEKLCSDLINDKAANERFTCSYESENKFLARITCGATDISYAIKYDVYDGMNKVYFSVNAMY
ncbi:MAG: hypothetical protein IJ349_00330 [Clostridia bacterium]|nr:hypothetical protein [Clostridia bacterium]